MWIWDSRTHQFIVAKALQKCSSTFRRFIKSQQELFILGVESPDRIFKDFTNHYYNCTPNPYGVHTGSIIKKIGKEIDLINRMLEEPEQIILHDKIAPFLSSLLDYPLKALIFELGVVSHYIADLHQPMHTDGKYRFEDEETVHKILEADTRNHLEDLQISLWRRHRIDDPIGYFTYQIYEINSFYDEIIDSYYLKPGKVKPSRWQNSKPTVEFCISTAVMNIANVYLSFEKRMSNFNKQYRFLKLFERVKDKTNSNNKYNIRKYATGSISLKRV